MRNLCLLFLTSGTLAFAQLDSGSITIAASRSITLQPDQVLFSVSTTTGLGGTLDQVVASLAPLGISASNFRGVSTVSPSTLQWSFTLPAPLANIKDTIASLQSMNLSFSVAGTQVSPELQASQQCSIPDLVSDARSQAQKMAAAAGLRAGSVLAIANTPAGGGINVPTFAVRTGDFSAPTSLAGFLLGLPAITQPVTPVTCSATIQFALQ